MRSFPLKALPNLILSIAAVNLAESLGTVVPKPATEAKRERSRLLRLGLQPLMFFLHTALAAPHEQI